MADNNNIPEIDADAFASAKTDIADMSRTLLKVMATLKVVNSSTTGIYEDFEKSADIAVMLVNKFKELNSQVKANNSLTNETRNFNKIILSDTKMRATVEEQMVKNIYQSEHDLAIAKARFIAENEKAIIDLSNLQKEKIKELMEAQRASTHDGSVDAEDYNKMLNEELDIRNKISTLTGAQTSKEIQDAKQKLDANNQLLKSFKYQAGYLAHIQDAALGTAQIFTGLVGKATRLYKELKSTPLPFLLVDALILSAFDRFEQLDTAAENFRRTTGFTTTNMVALRKNSEAINVQFAEMGVTIADAYNAAKALTDIFGRTSLVSKEAQMNVALMKANLNVVEEDAANVLSYFQGLGGVSQEVAFNIIKVGAGLSEKIGVSFSMVMKDIANSSEQTVALLGANPSLLMKSAIAARALGTDINKIAATQRKLLDFTTSINDELEASVMLGTNISFQKARQLTYDNKLVQAQQETLDVIKSVGDFNSLSVYQRESLAKAAGMELKDLTKLLAVEKQRDDIIQRGTPEQREKLMLQQQALATLESENDLSKQSLLDQNESAIRQQKMQGILTNLKNNLESITIALADVLEPLVTPIIGVLVPVLKFVGGLIKLIISPFKALAVVLGNIGTGN